MYEKIIDRGGVEGIVSTSCIRVDLYSIHSISGWWLVDCLLVTVCWLVVGWLASLAGGSACWSGCLCVVLSSRLPFLAHANLA